MKPSSAAVGARAALAPDGTFSGYASLFGVEDQGRDVVMPGAFRNSLAKRGAGGIRMLFQHDPCEPIGVWNDIREDARGLFVRGSIIAGAARGNDILALLQGGAIDGLSIGFRARRVQRDAATGQRRLYDIDLWEISVVTFPMLPGARILALRSATAAPVSRRDRTAVAKSFVGRDQTSIAESFVSRDQTSIAACPPARSALAARPPSPGLPGPMARPATRPQPQEWRGTRPGGGVSSRV